MGRVLRYRIQPIFGSLTRPLASSMCSGANCGIRKPSPMSFALNFGHPLCAGSLLDGSCRRWRDRDRAGPAGAVGTSPLEERRSRVVFFPEHQLVSELLVSEKLFTFGLALVLDLQRLVEDKPAATGVSTQGRTSGLVNVEFVLKGAGDLHTNIMAHFLQECVFFNQMPIGALYPPHEWRGFTARWIRRPLRSLLCRVRAPRPFVNINNVRVQ
ncbi:hypothetical protein HMPREF9465_00167 [Sutterella wadsworthensis 2_1_59BFAA]|uniref:Uncharacterized protein n=1 Tax=Sutterella wadsworthensis 2_1_59BFAA TaxID=742823 RepID=K1JWV7_9BURK|nr:hypothetical protein HMPREF9465_00167 [Sutterella wadsworthensis 2_1_59BFAA]